MKLSKEFRKLFIPIFLSFFIIVMAMSSFFVLYMNRKIVSTVYNTEVRNLRKAGEVTKLLIDQASTLAQQIHNDYQLKKLLFFDELETIEKIICIEQFKTYSYVIPNLHSIYLYNMKQDLFFIVTAEKIQLIQPPEDFFDQPALSMLTDEASLNTGRPMYRKIPSNGSAVYSFFFHFLGKFADLPVSTVIINFSEPWLQQQIRLFSFNDKQETVAIDTKGNILMGAGKKSKFLSDDWDSLIRAVLDGVTGKENGETEGYFLRNTPRKTLFTYHFREDLGWIYIRKTPYEDLLKPLAVIRTVALAVSALFLLATIIVSFLLSRRVYIPLRQAFFRNSELERERGEASVLINREMLQSFFMEPDPVTHSSVLRSLEDIDLKIDIHRPVYCIILSLDPHVHRQDDNKRLKDEICLNKELDKIREIWETEYPSETFLFKGGLILTILNDPENKNVSEKDLRLKTTDLISLLARDLNTSFSAVFDPVSQTLSEAAVNLADLEDAAEYRLIFGPGSCINMQTIRKRKSLQFEITKQEGDKLSAALNRKEFEEAGLVCFQVLNRAAECTHRSVRNASIQLISVINDAMNRFTSYTPSRTSVPFSVLLRDAHSCTSVRELKDFFVSFLDTIQRSLNTGLDNRRNEIVLAIKRIIKNKYNDPNLSSVLISEELGLSAPYAGRVFKEATGSSLPDFINEFRTERAKELLLTTDLSIQTILEKTGYNSTSHFYSVFRKLNGLTPTAYRWKQKSKTAASPQELSPANHQNAEG